MEIKEFEEGAAFTLMQMLAVKYRAPTEEEELSLRLVKLDIGPFPTTAKDREQKDVIFNAARQVAGAVVSFMAQHDDPVFVNCYPMHNKADDQSFGLVVETGVRD